MDSLRGFKAVDITSDMTVLQPVKPNEPAAEILTRHAVVDIKRARYYQLYDQLRPTKNAYQA